MLAILLVIVHTFIFELSIARHWDVFARDILIVSGFVFDLFFTIEFLVRSALSAKKTSILDYWLYERGWVDFLSSVPLLVLDSGPAAYMILTGHVQAESLIGVLNVLKVVKAIRVTRILRLVRIIKIFGKIHNASSRMAQHHASVISTITVFSIVIALLSFALFANFAGLHEVQAKKEHYTLILEGLKSVRGGNGLAAAKDIFSRDKNVLQLYKGEDLLVENLPHQKFLDYYNIDDYMDLKDDGLVLRISLVDIHASHAMDHIKSFAIIVLVVISIMFIYVKHFAQNISDILHILNKGFRKKEYNLEIKINDRMKDHEVYSLASFYNNAYLPAKLRRSFRENKSGSSGLSMDDLKNFKG
jgi:hypothetical protein